MKYSVFVDGVLMMQVRFISDVEGYIGDCLSHRREVKIVEVNTGRAWLNVSAADVVEQLAAV